MTDKDAYKGIEDAISAAKNPYLSDGGKRRAHCRLDLQHCYIMFMDQFCFCSYNLLLFCFTITFMISVLLFSHEL